MSRIEEIGEQLKSKLTELFEKIKETESYQQISDRYQTLTPIGQKIARTVVFGFVLLIFLFFPLNQIATSKEFIATFEEKRNLIRELFKTYRDSSQVSQLMPAPTSDSLIGTVNSSLQNEELLPEQIISINLGSAEGRLIPKDLMTDVVDVKLSKLNLRQIVDIGSRLAGISKSVKLKDLIMTANAEISGYFDVTYKLYSLNVPPPPVELPSEPEPKLKNKKSDSGKNDATDSDNSKSGDE